MTEDILELEEKLEFDVENGDSIDFAEFLAHSNKPEFNTLKLIEELAELQEKLIKYHLKVKEKKPSMESITDEIGDVAFRLMVFASQHDLDDLMNERIEKKYQKLLSYYKEGKYKGGI